MQWLHRYAQGLMASQGDRRPLVGGQQKLGNQLVMDAERAAASITDRETQAALLDRVDETLERRGDNSSQARARTIIAEILVSSSWWYRALPSLASLDPEAAISIGTAILNIENTAAQSMDKPRVSVHAGAKDGE